MSQFAEEYYPKSHILKIKALNTLVAVIGLMLAASPFAEHAFPGDFDTTVHVAVGTLIFACGAFRAGIGFGSLWMDVVSFGFGLIVLMLPKWQHMQWHPLYNTVHLAAGGAVMALAVIGAALTVPVLKKRAQ